MRSHTVVYENPRTTENDSHWLVPAAARLPLCCTVVKDAAGMTRLLSG